MKIFLSWSGERSKAVAAALAKWLPDVLQDLETWTSEIDIDAGTHWATELLQQLNTIHFGILCLTPENLTAPWLLFEAGAIAKAMPKARVAPYRIGLSATDIPYPLAQFQSVSADKDGTLKLLQSINAVKENAMPSDRLDRVFLTWWPRLEELLKTIPKNAATGPSPRSDRALLEEILQLVRQQSGIHETLKPFPDEFTSEDMEIWRLFRSLHLLTKSAEPKTNSRSKILYHLLSDLALQKDGDPSSELEERKSEKSDADH